MKDTIIRIRDRMMEIDKMVYIQGFMAVLVVILLSFVLYVGINHAKYQLAIADTEIWNGIVTSKERKDYTVSYECNCHNEESISTNSDGETVVTSHRVCQTCWKPVYDLYVHSSIDHTATIAYRNEVYEPEPDVWKTIKVGEGFSVEKHYTNYDKAAKTPLFRIDTRDIAEKYKDYIPEQPQVYDYFRINRFFDLSKTFNSQDQREVNEYLSVINGQLNPEKEVNVMIFLIPEYINKQQTDDFYYGVAEKWEGINKNEYIVFITVNTKGEVVLVQGLSWSVNVKKIELELDNYCANQLKIIKTKADMKKFLDETKIVIKQDYIRKEMNSLEFIDKENRRERGL